MSIPTSCRSLCLPPTRIHFWLFTTLLYWLISLSGSTVPRNSGLNYLEKGRWEFCGQVITKSTWAYQSWLYLIHACIDKVCASPFGGYHTWWRYKQMVLVTEVLNKRWPDLCRRLCWLLSSKRSVASLKVYNLILYSLFTVIEIYYNLWILFFFCILWLIYILSIMCTSTSLAKLIQYTVKRHYNTDHYSCYSTIFS